MNWFLNLFKKKEEEIPTETSEAGNRWYQGFDSFEKGKELFFNKQYNEALDFFDLAVKYGFERDGVYDLRGHCLHQLKYYLDAIEDFDRAISDSPEDFNLYFIRSISKSGIRDYTGEIVDLEKAIELSKKDNPINRAYVAHKKKWFSEADTILGNHLIFAKSKLSSASNRNIAPESNNRRK